MDNNMIVYKITNLLNSKIYIGCTTKDIHKRFYQHFAHRKGNTVIGKAFIKYGRDNFIIEELEKCDSRENMFDREKYWIEKLKSNENGYNLTNGGDCGPIKMGDENWNYSKKNLYLSKLCSERKGKSYEELYGIDKANEIKQKISEVAEKRRWADETKVKMSESRKKAWDDGKYTNIGEVISKAKQGKISSKRIKIKCLNNGEIYDSYTEAAQKLNLKKGNVSNVVNKKYCHTKGFVFEKI